MIFGGEAYSISFLDDENVLLKISGDKNIIYNIPTKKKISFYGQGVCKEQKNYFAVYRIDENLTINFKNSKKRIYTSTEFPINSHIQDFQTVFDKKFETLLIQGFLCAYICKLSIKKMQVKNFSIKKVLQKVKNCCMSDDGSYVCGIDKEMSVFVHDVEMDKLIFEKKRKDEHTVYRNFIIKNNLVYFIQDKNHHGTYFNSERTDSVCIYDFINNIRICKIRKEFISNFDVSPDKNTVAVICTDIYYKHYLEIFDVRDYRKIFNIIFKSAKENKHPLISLLYKDIFGLIEGYLYTPLGDPKEEKYYHRVDIVEETEEL